MNFQEIYTNVARRCGNPSDVDMVEYKRITNVAYKYICRRFRFSALRKLSLFTTTTGDTRYDLPLDAIAVFGIWSQVTGSKSTPLVKIDFTERTREAGSILTGVPTRYYVGPQFFELFPIPSAAYQMGLYYWADPETLVSDDDLPVVPLSWHDGIEIYARYVYYDERMDQQKAQYSLAAWKMWVSDKPDEIGEELNQSQGGVSVPVLMGRPF